MKVLFDVKGRGGFVTGESEEREMPGVPRVGEMVMLSYNFYEVLGVEWTPLEPGVDAYVTLLDLHRG